ncbi:YigZ family protein [Echinimonas agarilytica]|uniref:YigZ family protein n=1 Tax=Echinimonas agarilytica TaxID=1215918 RepID=A0AA42B5S3_9GAMM|nr:YigZ family protein [Echinimonas agarilytica]MCM2678070.1 YigZ family protein [Echinimonas agarilytica]
MAQTDYWRPEQAAEAEIEIKNSRFIAYLEPVSSLQEADQAKARIKALHPHARHHCWAQIVDTPFDVHASGSSDDGEPSGTAGRPMLAVLTGKPAGFLMVMVVRYFGGVKLGTGGLVRAYAGAVRAVFEHTQWQQCLPLVQLKITLSYPLHQQVLHLVARFDGAVTGSEFTDQVTLVLTVPLTAEQDFTQQLLDLGAGTIHIHSNKA